MKRGLAELIQVCLTVLIVGVAAHAATAEQARLELEAILASSDVELSEAAVEGVAVSIVKNPEAVIGGVKGGNGKGNQSCNGNGKGLGNGGPSGCEDGGGVKGGGGKGGGNTGGGNTGGGGSTGGGSSTGMIVNGEFTTDVSGWAAFNAYGGASSYGDIVADASSADGRFAVAHTGVWNGGVQGSLEQSFNIRQAQSGTFAVLYNFVTTEWSAASGPAFNDYAMVTLSNDQGAVSFSVTESAHGSSFTPVSGLPNEINGGRGQVGGQTGWLVANSGSLYMPAGTYTVSIRVLDSLDALVDSAILVDKVGIQ